MALPVPMALPGLACKNAILIVKFANHLEARGRDTSAATIEAARLRLRPIRMNSLAFCAGVLPSRRGSACRHRPAMKGRAAVHEGCRLAQDRAYISGSAVVSLIRCSAKLDFTSATAGWTSSVFIMKREKCSMSSTWTRNR